MAFLTTAVTALSLAGTPGLPTWQDTTTPSDTGTPRPYATTFTRLGLGGTAARLYGVWTRSPAPAEDRHGLGPYTQLGPRAMQARYGSFAGKAEISSDAKFPTETLRPVLTIGQTDAVDIDYDEALTPRWVVASLVGLTTIGSDTLRPVFTIGRGQVTTFNPSGVASSDTLAPRITEVVRLTRAVPSADTLTPVLAIVSSAATSIEALSSDTLTPVLTVTAAKLNLTQPVASSDTLTLALNYGVTVDRVTGALSWSSTDTLALRVSIVSAVGTVGEVDKIRFTDRPFGRIRIKPV